MNSRITSLSPVRSILVPVDFSADSLHALNYAASLAFAISSRLHVCHIAPVSILISSKQGNNSDDVSGIANDMMVKQQEIVDAVLKKYPGLKIDFSVSTGIVKDKILATALGNHSDLIIMGTHGASGWKEYVLGTNAEAIVQNAEIPVLVVPYSVKTIEFKKIAIATTFNAYDFQTLFQVTELFKPFHPEIEVLHVEEKNENATLIKLRDDFAKQVKSSITYDKVKFKIVESDDVYLAVHDFIKANNINILVISSNRKNVFEQFTGRSFSKKMVFHTEVPLLIYHDHNKSSFPVF
ncbi:MAG: universal stress protein [Bacteroidota bacterium]